MRFCFKGLLVVMLLATFGISVVVADDISCSFINITQGPPGADGSAGAAATITIGDVSTGYPSSVINSGTSQDAIFDFVLEKGNTGEKGDKGDPGEIPDVSDFLFRNGSRSMTGNFSMDSHYIIGLLSPSIDSDAATKGYVDSAVAGVSNYNASYATYDDLTWYATNIYVGEVNTSMKDYVDIAVSGISSYNASYLTSDDLTGYATETYVGEQGFITSTYNETYDALVRDDYVYNADLSGYATEIYVGDVNTSMKNYVDGAISGVSSYNATYDNLVRTDYVYTDNTSYWQGTNYNESYLTGAALTGYATETYVGEQGFITSTYNETYDGLIGMTNYNESYLTGADLLGYATEVYVGEQGFITSTFNSTYDAKPDSTFNSTYDALIGTTNYNSTYDELVRDDYVYTDDLSGYATEAYVGEQGFITSTFNATYDAKPDSNYNASYITSTFNATYDAKPDSTYNATYDALTGISNYNESYVEISNTSYFLVDGSRPLTGSLKRDVSNSELSLYGGDGTAGSGAVFSLMGKDYAAHGSIFAYVSDAAGTGYSSLFHADGATDTPVLNLDGNKIVSLADPDDDQDAATKKYVDEHASSYNASYWTGTNYNESYVTSGALSGYATEAYVNEQGFITSSYNATYDGFTNYNVSYLTSDDLTGYATEAFVGEQGFITSTYNETYDSLIGMTNYNASYLEASDLSGYATEAYVGEQGFITSTYNATYDAKPDSTYNATYDGFSNYNASYWTGTNYNSSYITSTFNSTYDSKPSSTYNATYDAKIGNPIYGYVTLMTGSAMVPTTNPATMDQAETSSQKNNYIYGGFTDGGSENLQWIVDMPGDWNGADADDGKLEFTFLWTGTSGSGTVKWDIAGKSFPDDAALDTALAAVGTATDTYIAASDMHVSPATTPAVVTSAGTAGQTIIFKVTRDSETDSFSGTAQLIGVRMKYIRTLA